MRRWIPGHGVVSVLDAALAILDAGAPYSLAGPSDALSCEPVMIVSAGRSGTTLLRSMLVVTGEIAMPPESYKIPAAPWVFLAHQIGGWERASARVVSLFETHPEIRLWSTSLEEARRSLKSLPQRERSLARVIDLVFLCYQRQHFPRAKLWGDQTAAHALFLPWVRRVFPRARYIHMLRDGRDVVASMIRKGEDVHGATRRWLLSVRQVQALEGRIRKERLLEVRYEDLVRDPGPTLRRICDFVGISYSPRALDFWKLPTTLEHRHYAHHENLRRPVFEDSIGQWTTRLSAAQKEVVGRRAGETLKALGYEDG